MARLTWDGDFRRVASELVAYSLVIPIHMGIVKYCTVMHVRYEDLLLLPK